MKSASLPLLAIAILLSGCGKSGASAAAMTYSAPTAMPPLPKTMELNGVAFTEVDLPRKDGSPRRLWIYMPKGLDPKGSKKWPVVFVAPAGTPLITGMALGEGDKPEEIPYAKAGFISIAYDLDGPAKPESNRLDELSGPIVEFRAAKNGVLNAKDAIDWAVKNLPIDTERIYAAGHSSSATLALQLAAEEPRIKAVAAYMPAPDLLAKNEDILDQISSVSPGYREYMESLSPMQNVAKVHCPIFLYSTPDDTNVPMEKVQAYAQALKAAGKTVTFKHADSGGHYDAMLEEGIPAGIAWLKSNPKG